MLSCPRALVIRGRGRPGTVDREHDTAVGAQGSALRPSRSNPKMRADDGDVSKWPVPAEQRDREADLIKRIARQRHTGRATRLGVAQCGHAAVCGGRQGTSIAGNLATARQALESGQAKAKLAELSAGAGTVPKVGLSA